jgi:multidrug efflux pump subunit AcrA (membrane-fusion protein)
MLFQNRSVLGIMALAMVFASCGRTAQKENTGGGEPVIPVRVQKPERMRRPVFVAASGTVEAVQTTDLGFQIPGLVARVFVEEGRAVRKGQVIAELDAADYQFGLQASEGQAGVAQASLDKAQAGTRAEEIEQARAAYEKAESEYQRYRLLYERKSMAPVDFTKVEAAYRAAKAQFEMAQNGARKEDRAAAGASVRQAQAQVGVSRKRISDTRLVSPINGIVARRSIDPGEIVNAGLPVFSIVDLNPVRVRVGIPESDIGRIRVGQRARVTVPALDGGEFQGTVDLVGVAADPSSRTFTAKISVPNPDLRLKAGMIAEASIEGSGMVDVVVVPGEAIVRDPQGSTLVYVYYQDRKRVHAHRVETGAVRDRGVEIHSGLSGDERVVVAGQHKLREGSLVEVMP